MSRTRRAEPRFVLPAEPVTVRFHGDVGGWRDAAAELAWSEPVSGAPPDLAVTDVGGLPVALSERPDALLVEGDARRELGRAGYVAQAWLLVRDRDWPEVLVPADDTKLLRHALSAWATPSSRWRALRSRAVVAASASGLPLPGLPLITVGCLVPARGFLLDAAVQLGAPTGCTGYHGLGGNDERRRGIVLLFPPRSSSPSHVLKHARRAGSPDAAARGAHERRLLSWLVPRVPDGSVPRPVRLGLAGSLPVSLETAVAGSRLTALLRSSISRRRKLVLLDALALWLLDLARTTAVTSQDGPRVTAHHDLWAGNNVLVEGDDVRVVDWEAGAQHSLPLYDILSSLGGGLAQVDRVEDLEVGEYLLRLVSGDSRDSPWLFGHVHRYAQALGLDLEVVARCAAATWDGLVRAGIEHETALLSAGMSATGWSHPARVVAQQWHVAPALGPRWEAYARWCAGSL